MNDTCKHQWSEIDHLTRPAQIKELPGLLAFVIEPAGKLRFSPKRCREIELVCEEVLVNIINYAYPENSPETISIVRRVRISSGSLELEIRDHGKPFNPLHHRAPDLEQSLVHREIGGLGIMMIHKFSNAITWQYRDGENRLTINFTENHD